MCWQDNRDVSILVTFRSAVFVTGSEAYFSVCLSCSFTVA